MTPLLVAIGAAVGAPCRFLLGHHLDRPGLPVGTFVANVAGSLLLGLFAGLALDGRTLALLGTGFCGGFTTYSSFAVQTHGLGLRRGAAYAVLTLTASLGACALGFLAGSHL